MGGLEGVLVLMEYLSLYTRAQYAKQNLQACCNVIQAYSKAAYRKYLYTSVARGNNQRDRGADWVSQNIVRYAVLQSACCAVPYWAGVARGWPWARKKRLRH